MSTTAIPVCHTRQDLQRQEDAVDSVEHLRSLLLHAMLPQGLTGNPQQVIDIAISPYERTVRFDYSLFLLLEKDPKPVRHIIG